MNKFGAKSGVLSGKLNSFRSFVACLTMGGVAVGVLGLGACTPQGPNQWMPRGYTYQDDTPLSSPAPSSPWLKEAELKNTDHMSANHAAWQGAVYEIVDQLDGGLSERTKLGAPAIFIAAEPPVTNHDQALDYYLRQALIQKGYKLSPLADAHTLTMKINVAAMTDATARAEAQKFAGFQYQKNMKLQGLYLLSAALYDVTAQPQTGQRAKPLANLPSNLPSYGPLITTARSVAALPYEKNEYMRLPGASIQPVRGLSAQPQTRYNP